ncbi:phosphotransferase family protein [Nocardioides piscis]|uniref:Phosphotransferase n=1 Tax=Nocardioides piscis TaxID=2714938 RepID=A0A6G7YIV2_9ACTN|nr:phosphotransferase [Nocardioides piscis]QIK76671.1 phosphotransferase [Nocardioides piscis]
MTEPLPEPLPELLTPASLGLLFDAEVVDVDAQRIGTGQMGSCYRLQVSYADDVAAPPPARMVVKLPAADPAARAMVAGIYRSEVGFYRDLAPTVDVRTPTLVASTWPDDEGSYLLALEDVAGAAQGDQVEGCTPAQARSAALNLVGLHAPRWCDPTLEVPSLRRADGQDVDLLRDMYPSTAELFFSVVGDLVGAETRETILACGEVIEAWSFARSELFAPVHGDYRLDNLLFSGDPAAPTVHAVDWQTLSLGPPTRDLAYLLGTGLAVDDRRTHERDIVSAYHRGLVERGVADYSAEQCWDDYALSMVQGPLVAIFGCAFGEKTERGPRMFAAMVDRACTAIRDLDTLSRV